MITTATICPKSFLCLSVPLPTRLDVLVLILIILIEHLMYNVQCQVECTELCPCRTLQQRARADRFKLSFLIVVKENLVVMIGTYSHWRPIHSTCGWSAQSSMRQGRATFPLPSHRYCYCYCLRTILLLLLLFLLSLLLLLLLISFLTPTHLIHPALHLGHHCLLQPGLNCHDILTR